VVALVPADAVIEGPRTDCVPGEWQETYFSNTTRGAYVVQSAVFSQQFRKIEDDPSITVDPLSF
jgi:hypothetical protein